MFIIYLTGSLVQFIHKLKILGDIKFYSEGGKLGLICGVLGFFLFK